MLCCSRADIEQQRQVLVLPAGQELELAWTCIGVAGAWEAVSAVFICLHGKVRLCGSAGQLCVFTNDDKLK